MQAISSSEIKWDYQIEFRPDLVVEVTNVCDRACNGCYAANIVSKKSKEEVYESMQGLFLDPDKLSELCFGLEEKVDSISLRGGEPTRHPKLTKIIEIVRTISKQVFLETHGRWITEDESEALLKCLSQHGVIVKISFDKMHGLKSSTLEKICNILREKKISYTIAITEKSFADFLFSRRLCHFEEDNSKFIYQKKVKTFANLTSPKVGVVNTNGYLIDSFNTRSSFKEAL